jgi:ankyrin repeat protein
MGPFPRRLSPACAALISSALLGLAGCGPIFETELQKAVQANDAAEVKRLLAAGASLGGSWAELTPPGRLALLHASDAPPDSTEILRLLIAAQPDPGAFLHQTFSVNCRKSPCYAPAPVEFVARQRRVEAVQILIDAGLDLRSQGVTNALVYAIAEDDEPMARFLVEAGADVNGLSTAHGNRFIHPISLLDAARRKENGALIEYLQARGAK